MCVSLTSPSFATTSVCAAGTSPVPLFPQARAVLRPELHPVPSSAGSSLPLSDSKQKNNPRLSGESILQPPPKGSFSPLSRVRDGESLAKPQWGSALSLVGQTA